MPRRRKVQASATLENRPRLQLPGGDEGKLLTPEQRKEKLELFLADYDEEVANKAHEMRSKIKSILSSYSTMCRLELSRYPKNVLAMPLKEFLDNGGSIDTAKVLLQDKLVKEVASSIASTSTTSAPTPSSNSAMDTISEDGASEKPSRRGNKRRALAIAQSTTSKKTRSSARLNSRTPAMNSTMPRSYDTPLHTPAFHPRLPKTPACVIRRVPKPDEFVMSLNGSPLVNNSTNNRRSAAFKMSVGKDKYFMLPKNRLLKTEERDVELDRTTMKQLQLMKKNLAYILKEPHPGSD